MTARLRRSWPIVAILCAFLLLGFAYSAVNPLHEATDELRHYRFIQYLIQRDGLPIQGEGGDLDCTTQGHHPPLFYLSAALVTGWVDTGRDVCHEPQTNPFWAYRYWEVGRDNKNQYLHTADEAWPWRGEALAAHLARAINLLFGAATVWLTWATARAIWPRRPALAAGAAAFVAFNPMFLYMAGAINNDVVAAMAGAAVTYACVRLLLDPKGLTPGWGAALGALFGLALMSKFNLAAIVVAIGATMTWVAWRRNQWRAWLGAVALAALVSAAIAGWWFVRNQVLYGEPTGVERLTELWGVRDPRDSFWLAVSELPYAWTSLWGRFGYGQIPLPPVFYAAVLAVALLALGGYLYAWLLGRMRPAAAAAPEASGRPSRSAAGHPATAPLLLLGLVVLLFFAVLFNYLLISPAGPMGRFFFPALPALAILLFHGLSLWLSGPAVEDRIVRLAVAANGLMFAFAVVALAGYLAPAYAPPPAWPEAAALPNATDARFDTLVALRGYDAGPSVVRPGEPIDLELYWEVTGRPPGDYLLFVHLIDTETGAIIAQRDTHPGLGNFPSSRWQPGDRFVERVRLYLPETAYAPASAELRAGLYAPGAYRLGITDAATGDGLGDSFRLGEVAVEAPAGDADVPNPGDYNFEDRVRLLGYAYDRRSAAPGEALAVTLYWEASQPDPGDYELQVRLTGPDGSVAASHQAPPDPAMAGWRPGETVTTTHAIGLESALSPGDYSVEVALVDPATGRRLNLIGEDGRWLFDVLRLGPVRVEGGE
jgi:hypothetical protein